MNDVIDENFHPEIGFRGTPWFNIAYIALVMYIRATNIVCNIFYVHRIPYLWLCALSIELLRATNFVCNFLRVVLVNVCIVYSLLNCFIDACAIEDCALWNRVFLPFSSYVQCEYWYILLTVLITHILKENVLLLQKKNGNFVIGKGPVTVTVAHYIIATRQQVLTLNFWDVGILSPTRAPLN